MKIALAQVNVTVGAFDANRRLIEQTSHEARQRGAKLVVFPELALCGYPPDDLLLRPGFFAAHERALTELAANVPPDLAVLVGCIARNERPDARPLFNSVALLEDGLARIVSRKTLLPTYDVFDESRWFESWPDPLQNIVTIAGRRVAVLVCEDGWNDPHFFARRRYAIDPVQCVVDAGAQIVVNLSASPFDNGKPEQRTEMVRQAALRHRLPMIYVNLVGGNVSMQFDGGSVATRDGALAFPPEHFVSGLYVVDTEQPWTARPSAQSPIEMQYKALVQGIRDYVGKFGFAKVMLGLSGGIDSALTAVLAVDALGAGNVLGVALPSMHSSDHSVRDAKALAELLGIGFEVMPIQPVVDAAQAALAPGFAGTKPGLAEENLQARARGLLLMAMSNKHGHLLLATGNKSELAVGYCTLYGDMCGALSVLGDLWKTEVYAMARWINRDGERIPTSSIGKPPSAELRPDQLDTDSLPPYEVLDPILQGLVERSQSVADVARQTGADVRLVAELYRKFAIAEFKRVQAAPTLRLTARGWAGWRMQASHGYLAD